MVVQHNISAMNANRYYGINNKALAGSLEKLSSGYAINRAGDNAAGLAVSEKMRAQIGGLTQASKNAEDGISMVQTFEGALQETDSILQRMRSLAVQSANGTYSDDVDREAMQLEFDQLNDELNQIADTDFNGVVMLNGGQMADGLKADVTGKFDYANYTRGKMQLSSQDVTKVDAQKFNDRNTGTLSASNQATTADDVWYNLNNTWNRYGYSQGTANTSTGPDEINITMKYDKSSGSWAVDKVDNGIANNKIAVTNQSNGGFKLATATGSKDIGNFVVDEHELQNGDTLVIKLSNKYSENVTAGNLGASVADTTGFEEGTATGSVQLANANLTIAKSSTAADNVTDAAMTDAYNRVWDALEGATATANYHTDSDGKGEATAAGDLTFELSDGTKLDKATITAASNWTKQTLQDGTEFYIKAEENKVTFAGKSDGKDVFAEISMTAATATTAAKGSSGEIKYTIGKEYANYDKATEPTVSVVDADGLAVSKSNAFEQSKATMTYADNMYLQVGARTKDEVNFTFKYNSNGLGGLKANLNCSSRTDGLGTAELSLKTAKDANAAIDQIDNAINKTNMIRATFGAVQNRLEHKINTLDTNNENLTAAESRIRDTQMDKEMMKFTSSQILSQASQSMLAQANSLPQGVLQLLG